MRILITGGSGLLGQYLNIRLSLNNEIFTLYNEHPGNCLQYNSQKTDIRNTTELGDVFEKFPPEIVIHTAAISQTVLRLSSKIVYSVNVESTKNISEFCRRYNSKLIYISTDLVYAGYRGSMLKEDAKIIPVSLYAETKLMGEEKIKITNHNYLILRTALLYGFGKNHSTGHFHKMYNDLKAGNKVNLFTDQYRTPLSLPEAARMVEEICSLKISNEIINFGGPERVSRFELGEILCESAGFDKDLLIPIKMSDLKDYPVVEDVSMDTSRLNSLGIIQKSIRASIDELQNS